MRQGRARTKEQIHFSVEPRECGLMEAKEEKVSKRHPLADVAQRFSKYEYNKSAWILEVKKYIIGKSGYRGFSGR